MAVDRNPEEIWEHIAYAAGPPETLTFQLDELPGLTAAKAAPTTGDWPTVIQAVLQSAYAHYANLPTADKPEACTITQSVSAVTSGDFAGSSRVITTFTAYVAIPVPGTVEPEPA